jgi:hypothetical protein
MLLDEKRVSQIKEVFKSVSEYKELAKGHNATATSNMKGLIESLSADKAERKELKKIMKKAYKEWEEKASGEADSITEALAIVEKL